MKYIHKYIFEKESCKVQHVMLYPVILMFGLHVGTWLWV
jgi:hypothetical protein